MSPNDQSKFLDRLGLLFKLHGRNPIPGVLLLYVDALDDVTYEKVDAAIKLAVRQLRFLPMPAELRAMTGVDAPKPLAPMPD